MQSVIKLLVACGVTAATLGAAEVVLRALPAERLGFEYSEGVFRGPREFTPDATANRFGFHDVDHGTKRPAGPRRVVLLGDSYVAALSVPLADTVGRRLESALRARTGQDVEVIALGRPGWGQRDELRVLDRFADSLEPDVVLTLVLTLNDLRDNSPALDAEATAQLARIAHFRPGWTLVRAERAPLFWIKASRLNQLVSHRLALLADRLSGAGAREIPIDYRVYTVPPGPEWLAARDTTEALLRALRDRSAAAGAAFAVATASTPHGARGAAGIASLRAAYPAMRGLQLDFDQPDRWIAELCAEERIPFHALEADSRRATAAGQLLHWPFDGHWNAAGNAFAAEHLADLVAPLLAERAPRPH